MQTKREGTDALRTQITSSVTQTKENPLESILVIHSAVPAPVTALPFRPFDDDFVENVVKQLKPMLLRIELITGNLSARS